MQSSDNFALNSSSISPGSMISHKFIFNGFGCHGQNLSPALEWSGAPPETKSFALIVHDPDAHQANGWYHWMVIDIPADVTRLEEGISGSGNLPRGAREIRNDFDDVHYGGPCPPKGDKPHRYVFTLYALKVEKLQVRIGIDKMRVEEILEENRLAKVEFYATYYRQ